MHILSMRTQEWQYHLWGYIIQYHQIFSTRSEG
jgi:hypothetical protein